MGKKQNQIQLEKFIEMASDMEHREIALEREEKKLRQRRAALEQRERTLAAQGERQDAPPAFSAADAVKRNAQRRAQQGASADTVGQIAEVLKTIFWDYSGNVQQISSQMSTVTAAMMCAAVSCVLENRGFNAKEVFLAEMQKMLDGGMFATACPAPAPAAAPSAAPAAPPAAAGLRPAKRNLNAADDDDEDDDDDEVENDISALDDDTDDDENDNDDDDDDNDDDDDDDEVENDIDSVAAPREAVKKPAPGKTDDDDDDDDDDEIENDIDDTEPALPRAAGDGVLRIESVDAFQKLGEYGLRNDDTIVRVELPDGITQLPGSFFYGCRKLEAVTLPDSCIEIGPYAFYGCEKLETVNLGEFSKLREIGEYAFAMCGSLRKFEVPAQVEALGTSVFRFCSKLQKIIFSKVSMRLRTIGSHLLQNCTALEKVRLPESVTAIPTSMFYGCSGLKKVVAKGVDTIENYAFYGNENLRTLRIRANKSVAPQAFEGCSPALRIETLQPADNA